MFQSASKWGLTFFLYPGIENMPLDNIKRSRKIRTIIQLFTSNYSHKMWVCILTFQRSGVWEQEELLILTSKQSFRLRAERMTKIYIYSNIFCVFFWVLMFVLITSPNYPLTYDFVTLYLLTGWEGCNFKGSTTFNLTPRDMLPSCLKKKQKQKHDRACSLHMSTNWEQDGILDLYVH